MKRKMNQTPIITFPFYASAISDAILISDDVLVTSNRLIYSNGSTLVSEFSLSRKSFWILFLENIR